MRLFSLCAVLLVLGGCGGVSYRPVQEVAFEQIADRGCTRGGDRFSTTAYVNAAYRETIVLWDGRNAARTLAVTLPGEGLGSRLRGVVGDSRYDLSVRQLEELRQRGTPVTLTMRCERGGGAPVADRFSYFEDGQRVDFEF